MDPNANLEEMLRLANKALNLSVEEAERNRADLHADSVRLAELVLAMHEWLNRDGALPDMWAPLQASPKPANKKVEAYGTRGLDSRPWRKTFKSVDAMNKWVEENDAQVAGTRNA